MLDLVGEHQSRLLPPRATSISGNRKNFTFYEIPANSGIFLIPRQTWRKFRRFCAGLLGDPSGPTANAPRRRTTTHTAPGASAVVNVHGEMSTVHAHIQIDVPVRRVWDTVMDPHHLKDWVTIHRSVNNVSDDPLRKGSTMDQALHIRGVSFHVHWTLIDISAPMHAEWEGQGPAHSVARIRYELSGDGNGPTRFAYTNEFMAPGGRLGNVASRFIVGATSEREANNSLARLKALLERRT